MKAKLEKITWGKINSICLLTDTKVLHHNLHAIILELLKPDDFFKNDISQFTTSYIKDNLSKYIELPCENDDYFLNNKSLIYHYKVLNDFRKDIKTHANIVGWSNDRFFKDMLSKLMIPSNLLVEVYLSNLEYLNDIKYDELFNKVNSEITGTLTKNSYRKSWILIDNNDLKK